MNIADRPMNIAFGEAPHEVLARAGAPVPDDIQPIFDSVHTKQKAIRADTRYTDVAKAELMRAAEVEGRVKFDAAFERLAAEQGARF